MTIQHTFAERIYVILLNLPSTTESILKHCRDVNIGFETHAIIYENMKHNQYITTPSGCIKLGVDKTLICVYTVSRLISNNGWQTYTVLCRWNTCRRWFNMRLSATHGAFISLSCLGRLACGIKKYSFKLLRSNKGIIFYGLWQWLLKILLCTFGNYI